MTILFHLEPKASKLADSGIGHISTKESIHHLDSGEEFVDYSDFQSERTVIKNNINFTLLLPTLILLVLKQFGEMEAR